MPRLERLRISGFKSFSDATEVVFPGGITAVVGPNGCGKSNIGDALSWILGEQSAKSLRGGSMQDVIFNGSEERKPLGMAEVSLHLAGLNGSPDGSTRDVVLTRRLFRSGDSEYLIDGARARLKDIQEILREARIGAQTYATIEQGRIDQILNAKPKERRLILEDAAGIVGYKHKRRLAELKLEATQANLLRVRDIVGEVRRQINSLKRQAAKARRYQRLRDELRGKERSRFGARARSLDAELSRWREAEAAARDAESAAAAELASLEAGIAADRLSLEEAERGWREAADALHQLEIEMDRDESGIRLCRERIGESRALLERLREEEDSLTLRRGELREEAQHHAVALETERRELSEAAAVSASKQSELGALERDLAALRESVEGLRRRILESTTDAAESRNRRRALGEALERNLQGRGRLRTETAAAEEEIGRLDAELAALDGEMEAEQRVLERLREEHARFEEELQVAQAEAARENEALAVAREQAKSAAASLRTLEDVATRFAGLSDGVALLMTEGPASGVRPRGIVADFVEAAKEFEGVAEAYLEPFLPAVVVDDDAETRRAAELLRAAGAGRTLLVSRAQPAAGPVLGSSANGRPPFPEELLRDPRVRGRLRDRITLRTGGNGAVEERIGDAVIVDSLESALDLHRVHPRADYLTSAGEVVFASGVVLAGGRSASEHGLLAHNRRMQEARQQLAESEARAAALRAGAEERRIALDGLQAGMLREQGAQDEARGRAVELGMRRRRVADERDRTSRRIAVLAAEAAQLEEESGSLGGDLDEASREVEEAEAAQREVAGELEDAVARLAAAERRLRELGDAAAVLRAEAVVRRQRVASEERESERLAKAIEEIDARVEANRAEAESARRREAESADTLAATEADLAARVAERERRVASGAEGQNAIEDLRAGLQEREGQVREARAEVERLREEVRSAELGRAGSEADRRHLDELCLQELGVTAIQAAEESGPETDATDPDSLEAEITELRERIDSLGPVNLTAIDEFAELEERYRFLTSQQSDLERSMESLRETIRRINRSSRDRFLEAFEAIRVHFQEVFQSLFHGGRADLRLEEGDDVLESGVEILVQPPGKRPGNVHLLSGGEKAMSAIALLFAIFRYQPSPFCLLDEVDAALDDLNVNRFTRMLRDYASQTQFILITHNKRSMESANLLYGVTMEEPGVSKLVSLKL